MFSIFEGFELIVFYIIPTKFILLDSLNFNLGVLVIIIIIISTKFSPFFTFAPKCIQYLLELFYKFILNIINEQAGINKKKTQTINNSTNFFGPIFILGFTILFFNLLGLLPYSYAITGLFAVTISLSTIYFFSWIILGITVLRFSMTYLFFPEGVNIFMQPLMFIIEFISFIMRPLSLAIRLFANILAGHVLLNIIANGALVVINALSSLFKLFSININPNFLLTIVYLFLFCLCFSLIIILILLIFGFFVFLELGVAFLQTYVFVTLIAIYLKDSLHAHRTGKHSTNFRKTFFPGTMSQNH